MPWPAKFPAGHGTFLTVRTHHADEAATRGAARHRAGRRRGAAFHVPAATSEWLTSEGLVHRRRLHRERNVRDAGFAPIHPARDLERETNVVAAHHRLAQLSTLDEQGRISPLWLDAHRRFHAALVEGCPSPRLLDVAARLQDATEVY
ncbi:hypothetical protein GCM10023081_14080 [Arthrobacter ginkgonis]|uniref:Uncharacterized protein n=1 Tax=Arthrobacter ginkgonis TaxID=1630594 RepID=A0ABP7C4E4_9MICC